MMIEHVNKMDESAAMFAVRLTTSGIVSGYQRTCSTASGVATATTGNDLSSGIDSIPRYSVFIVDIPELLPLENESLVEDDEEIEGYRRMGEVNLEIAEESLPIALENWPEWDD